MLWGNKDYGTGNNKPLWANTSNNTSGSTINGSSANVVYGAVMGVSTVEMQAAAAKPWAPAHAGWVSVKIGTGPLVNVVINNRGQGINSAGFLTISDSNNPAGSGANASYTIANSQNSLQAYSTNAWLNSISTITINSGGANYANVSKVTISAVPGIVASNIYPVLGGRAGQYKTEVLVAMKSISTATDDPRDNAFFTGA